MTRKDYEVIATALAQSYVESSTSERKGVGRAIEHIAHALQVENERFLPKKFHSYIRKMVDTAESRWS